MRTVLLLEDRLAIGHNLINQGDKAIAEGTHRLLEKHQFRIRSGGYKNFPYFNLGKFRNEPSVSEIEKVFEKQFNSNFSRGRDSGLRNKFMRSKWINNKPVSWMENRFRKKYSRGLLETLDPYLFRNYHARTFFERVQASDLVIFNGSGLLADHLKFYLPCYLLELFSAKRVGKKVVLANFSVSVETPWLKRMVEMVIRDLDFFMVREPISKVYLLDLGIDPAKIRVVPDFSFSALEARPPGEISAPPGGTIKIGLFIRGDRSVNYPFWSGLLKALVKTHQCELFFFHTCKSHDQKVFDHLSRHNSFKLEEINLTGDYADLIDPLSHMNLVLTDRYHGMIFSLFAQVPAIGFDGTTFKNRGLAELMDYPLPVFPVSEDRLSAIQEAVSYTLGNQSTLRRQIQPIPQEMQQWLRNDIEILKDL